METVAMIPHRQAMMRAMKHLHKWDDTQFARELGISQKDLKRYMFDSDVHAPYGVYEEVLALCPVEWRSDVLSACAEPFSEREIEMIDARFTAMGPGRESDGEWNQLQDVTGWGSLMGTVQEIIRRL